MAKESLFKDQAMTNQEIFTQIIHEVSGRPKSEITHIVAVAKQHFGKANWDKDLPEKEAKELLEKLRGEKEGIRDWLIKGRLMAEADIAAAQGRMN